MKTGEIKKLLEKYYNAETSEEEELLLRNFFRQEDVPGLFTSEKEIFNYYDRFTGAGEPPAGLEQKIIMSVGRLPGNINVHSVRRIFVTVSAIAAVLIVMAATYFFLLQNGQPRDTFSDPEIAYTETLKILNSVSVRLNKGTQALATVGKMQQMTEKTMNDLALPANIIDNKLKPLDRFRNTIEAIGSLHKENNQ